MSYFVVTRAAGPKWTDGKGAFDQPEVIDHAAFMSALADEGVLLFAGPVDGSEIGRIRVVLIADGVSEADIRAHLAGDPWERAERIVTSTVEPWNVIVGGERLSAGLEPPRR